MRLEGKVALITGAASGIGQAAALAFAAEGAAVVCAGLVYDAEQQTARTIEERGGKALAVETDVRSQAAIEHAIGEAVAAFGALDVLMNNAGVGRAPWDDTIAINLSSVYYGTRYAAELMAERGGGSIINVSSVLGLVGRTRDLPPRDAAPYAASKHGVLGLTRSFAVAYGPRGVRVNAVCPGYIETPMLAPAIADTAVRDALVGLHPIGRLGRPEEVARVALFLASDDASFVTGAAIPVDGGYTAQ